jgi:hypothetical protein
MDDHCPPKDFGRAEPVCIYDHVRMTVIGHEYRQISRMVGMRGIFYRGKMSSDIVKSGIALPCNTWSVLMYVKSVKSGERNALYICHEQRAL